jgi:purine-binding chemotaxis protein CheW
MGEDKTQHVVVFDVGSAFYGIFLSDTIEILRIPEIIRLPKAPPIVEGVVNIRGRTAAVLDIRARFQLPVKEPELTDHLVVAKAGKRLVAFRVDRVVELTSVDTDAIENAKDIVPTAEYIAGIAKLQDDLVLIHDLQTFLSASESETLGEVLSETRGTSQP